MMNRNLLTLSLAALLPLSAMAADDAPDRSLFVGANLTDGNSETESVTAEVKLGKKTDAAETLFAANWAYGKADSVKNVDNGGTSLQFNPFISETAYGYGKTSAAYDDVAGVDYRVIVGAGLGTYLVKTDANEFAVEAGPSYVFEKLGGVGPDPADASKTIALASVKNDYLAIRFAERSSQQISESAKLYQSVEFLPEAEDFDSYLIRAEAGVESALAGNLSLRFSVKDTYDSTPAPGREDNDLTVSAGVVLTL